MSNQVQLLVTPTKALVDDKVDITVERLAPGQPVTLHARLVEGTARFQSYAHYRADDTGRVVVAKQPSLGGLYAGIEQMGLFWSMQPSPGQKPGLRLRKKDVSTPFLVEVSVHEGNVAVMGEKNLACLATKTIERWYLGDDVKRIPVKEGRVRGTLFLPPGKGPFAGVVDIFGSTGGLPEYRAALLASRGFAALALPYFGYDDLPENISDIDLDYFEEAVDWFLSLPNVRIRGVGVLATSYGGHLALCMAVYMNKVDAVAVIGSYTAVVGNPLPYKSKVLPCARFVLDQVIFTKEGFAYSGNLLEDTTKDPGRKACIQVEKTQCPIMFVAGEDDLNVKSVLYANQAIARMKDHGKTNYTLLSYPWAGHLIEPPYTPHCGVCYHAVYDKCVLMGGEPKGHAAAQEDSWHKILDFFRAHVGSSAHSKL
ncbi:PREDICTED: acyl-coenzyme A thioesterase 1-like [Branchiostoma belcheri]|uniref:Acyl-coenzyme A thioesterase 1-like n=1 Tax=Branchiostoma belcheri TaxID=7741 RepID=A0A6P4ZID6_BRABE|nr:PREDICTED: acyl-coenzyme A thioesterase 1-like [Branchiostoma belcheri]